VRADGGYESTTEVQLKINTPQGVRSGGSQSVDYIASQDEVLSIEAWTIQPDGTKVTVPESSIRTQDEQADESAAKFSDTKLKVIIFPNVEAGSRLLQSSSQSPFPDLCGALPRFDSISD
jgi:hypothetical protein